MPRTIQRFGWKPDLPDHRDQFFSASRDVMQSLPPKFDLTVEDPCINFPIYDQKQVGSCTANALAAAVQFDRRKAGQNPDFVPSRLFLYYNERTIEHSVANDSGASLRDGMKTLQKTGICPEADWPYDGTPAEYDGGPFPVGAKAATRPTQKAYDDAANYTITSYQALQQSLSQLQAALVSGFPFAFGFSVYESWTRNDATVIPMPSDAESQMGGHAVLAVGYDNQTALFKFRNSWGDLVGEDGYFYIPYAYVLDRKRAGDFWVINGMKD
ncbi:C1 family peptidase [Terriglobus albidus]|uniref:C1 family peptidase n=1 Tax=Terriglobus albidus TaxID=1592106 RepID=A0A5B9EHK2_9BACT|nr:C1 family peptidase [Terriglobus albidus]QEE29837.1 C1 family peptidase [Terriglobus albidus]